jgi:cullin-4
MAAYLNHFLIKDCQGKSQQEQDDVLSSVIRLFCCLSERDTFVKNCEHYLHLRLLNKTMLSKETEEQLIKKIQGEVGFNSGAKMVAMFKDMDLSKDIASKFNEKNANAVEGLELSSIQVLSQGTWPIDMSDALKLEYPLRLKRLHEKFADFYKMSFQNKTLHMLNQYGSCELKASFNTKLIITTTVVQACILNCFNDSDVVTYGDMKTKLNIDESMLQGNLKPLVFGNGAMIKKQRANLKWDLASETLTLNTAFKSNAVKVVLIPKVQATANKEKKAGDGGTNPQIEKERNMVIQGNIVKIMKTNQGHSVNHQDVMSQTIDLCRLFKAQPQMIKGAIEHLITTGYMRRDENSRTKYWYIA